MSVTTRVKFCLGVSAVLLAIVFLSLVFPSLGSVAVLPTLVLAAFFWMVAQAIG